MHDNLGLQGQSDIKKNNLQQFHVTSQKREVTQMYVKGF